MEVIIAPWMKGLAVGAIAGAFKAGAGIWKNSPDDDFELKVKKTIPAIVVGAAAGAIIGYQELPVTDAAMESVIIAFGAIGIDELLENFGKGIAKRVQNSGWYTWLFG